MDVGTLERIAKAGDEGRLAALNRYDILDTGREESFDRISRLIKLTLDVDIAVVSLMDAHRQWFKSMDGMDAQQVPLDIAFCRYMLDTGEGFTVSDAAQDPRFSDNPFVTGPAHVRSYAGVPLQTPDGFTIGSVCAVGSTARDFTPREQSILQELADLVMDQLALRRIAAVDSLTSISSRRAFKEDAQKFVTLARRHRYALSCISFDLDHFKAVNDTYGHPGGDQVLVAVASAVSGQLRQSDLFGRLGGEEFSVLLPHTDGARAMEVADKLRLAIRALVFPGSQPPISVTASFGIAALDASADDIESLLQKSDEALYEAKRTGRNRCALWHPSGTKPQGERRRVLKAGQIVFNNRHSTLDCTLRALGETTAEIAITDAHLVPETFILRITTDGTEWPCRVTGRTEQRVIVEFEQA